jgi:hypothetical protein
MKRAQMTSREAEVCARTATEDNKLGQNHGT